MAKNCGPKGCGMPLGLFNPFFTGNYSNPYYYSNQVTPPDYDSLSNLELYVDYTGLETGTTNDYGVVDGSGNVTTLKSLAPSPLTRDFTSVGTAPTLTADGIVFGGAGRLRAGVASKTWANFLHYNATATSLKSTIHAVVKFGTSSDPDAFYGLIGNNGAAGASKGFCVFYDDRAAVPRSNAFRCFMTQGGGNYTLQNDQAEVITPNQYFILTIETEFSSTDTYKQRVYINGRLYGVDVVYSSVAMVTTPTYDLEIGGVGNAAGTAVITLKELVIQSAIDSSVTRSAFIEALINKHNITTNENTPTVDISQTMVIIDTYQEAVGKYYLSAGFDQHPTKKYLVLRAVLDGQDHTADPLKKITVQKSLDYGLTKGSNIEAYNPTGDTFAGDLSSGFSDNGRHHIFTDTHIANGTTFDPPHKLIYLYSTDEGSTYTDTDLTSLIPVDDLLTFRTYGNVIENNSVLMTPGYRLTDEGTTTNSERFILRSTDGGANWTYITVERTSDYINEGTIIGLDNTRILMLCRNEVTLEFTQYLSSDNGLTWVNQGNQSFGETLVGAGPCRLVKFKIETTDVIACYYPDRANNLIKVIYGTAAGIITNGLTGFISGSKTTLFSGTGRRPHYGDYMHPMNNMNAIMLTAYEKNPLDLSNNDLITAILPSTQYATVKTALGL